MTDPHKPVRLVPRWLHVWAVLTVVTTLILLVLGQLVTSFRAGMADPIWPTEPWYLFVVGWKEPDRGYLIEHSHRIAGWAVGGVVSVLALGLWWTEPRKRPRQVGLAALLVLLAAFGQFHGALISQRNAVEITVPMGTVAVMAALLAAVLSLALWGAVRGVPGSGLRILAVVTLVAVMVQGLLGGFRVRLDALFGPELAPVHGVFAQVVFCLLVALAVLTARRPSGELPVAIRRPVGWLSLALVGLLFVQLVWGAMVRHTPNAINQRLHILTAFLVVGLAVWLLRLGFSSAAVRQRVARTAWALALLVTLQVALGVEAWMGKFGEEARKGKSAASFLPEAEKVTAKQAGIRTAHALIGTGVLAAAVTLALRVRLKAGNGGNEEWSTADRPGDGVVLASSLVLTAQRQPGETPC